MMMILLLGWLIMGMMRTTTTMTIRMTMIRMMTMIQTMMMMILIQMMIQTMMMMITTTTMTMNLVPGEEVEEVETVMVRSCTRRRRPRRSLVRRL